MCRGNDNRTADRAEEFGNSPGRAHCASQLTAGKLLFSLLFTNALPGDFCCILSSPFSVLATSRCHAARALLCYAWGKRTQRVQPWSPDLMLFCHPSFLVSPALLLPCPFCIPLLLTCSFALLCSCPLRLMLSLSPVLLTFCDFSFLFSFLPTLLHFSSPALLPSLPSALLPSWYHTDTPTLQAEPGDSRMLRDFTWKSTSSVN